MSKLNSKIPVELLQKQEQQRQTTVNIVLHAISELKEEGHKIRIKDLIDYTNLSRSVFSKKHIRAVLIRQGIVTEKDRESTQIGSNQSSKERLKQKLTEKDLRIHQLTAENASLKNECEVLRGKLFLLMQRQSLE